MNGVLTAKQKQCKAQENKDANLINLLQSK